MSIFNHFRHLTLSTDQENALKKLEMFLASTTQVFMLKGYAGSGKTTILKGLAEYLDSNKKAFALMAPTGRAAKVIRDKTGKEATTIHKGIYNFDELETINDESVDEAEHSFHYYFPINSSGSDAKIIIVDESSMISSKESKNELFTFGTEILLNDLMTYASLQTTGNKIIFVGDPAQLPPVGDSNSWALDASYFEKLKISTDQIEMKQVLRQGNNLILTNAEKIRKTLEQTKRTELKLDFDETSFVKIEPIEVNEKYTELFPKPEIGDGVIVSYSNSQCYRYNVSIRKILFPNQNNIVAGDLVLINNNNYHTYGVELFNGDIAKVVSVSNKIVEQSAPVICDDGGKKIRKIITLHFREITIRVPNYSEEIVCNIIDSHLHSVNRDLSFDEMKALYINFLMRFNDLQKKRKETGQTTFKVGSDEFKQALKSDRFFNALRVKFGYAITCHKSQGGEWNKVFVDYFGRVSLRNEPLRWCYTATTRGIHTVYAINPPRFSKMDKFKFAAIGNIGTLPNEALALEDVKISPFHSILHHKCKSLKYWEVFEKLENTSYSIEKVETFGYLERYNIINEEKHIQIQANHRSSGHFVEKFQVLNSTNETQKIELESIFNADFISYYAVNYSPSKNFLADLFSKMQEECSNLSISITNVVEGKYFVNYYLKTDSICSYIQFYYNDKDQLTTAMPKTYGSEIDNKLQTLIQNLLQYAV